MEEMPHSPKSAYEEGRLDLAKELLLEHYAEKPVTRFLQFDGFANVLGDDVMHPDEHGDAQTASTTHELMSGVATVRVLIRDDASKEDAVRLLKKLAEWVERDMDEFKFRYLTEAGRALQDAELRGALDEQDDEFTF